MDGTGGDEGPSPRLTDRGEAVNGAITTGKEGGEIEPSGGTGFSQEERG